MANHRRIWTPLLTIMGIAIVAALMGAQAPKSKSGAASKRSRPTSTPAAKPARPAVSDEEKAEAKAEEKKKAAMTEELPAVTLPDPAVEAVLETKPSTPSELIRAAKVLADLRRPDLAKGYFAKVLGAKLDPKALAALADEFGPAMFAGIATRSELAPEGKQVADAVLGAKIHELQDPQRIAGLIRKLGDPSAEVRGQAIVGLQDARGAAVGPLLAVLIDPQRTAEQAGVRAALAALGPEAQWPLVAMLDASDPKIVVEAIDALGTIRGIMPGYFLLRPCYEEAGKPAVRAAAEAAAMRAWRPLPDRQRAAHLLADLSRRYAKRAEPLATDASGRIVLWSWDEAKKQAIPKSYPPDDAARWLAARFARDAHAILPGQREMHLLHLTALLEQAASDNGLDNPLSMVKDSPAAKVSALGAGTVEEVLAFAVHEGQAAAAAAAARILGQLPEAERLLHRTAQPCPLVLATRHPDRRLRLAAVEAIMRLAPPGPYPGASYVREALGFMAASHGARRVLVGSPRIEEARRLAGYLARLGYETDQATTGRDLLRKALQSPDIELILVEAIVSYPTVDELLQSLRRDGRTALVPVGVLAAAGDFQRAEHIVRNDPLAAAFPRPHDLEAVRHDINALAARSGDMPSAAVRKRHATLALGWLARLGQSPTGGQYDLSRGEESLLAALAVPGLAAKACAALGNLGTPEAQQALVDLASRKTAPLADRKAAVEGFRTAVQRRGVLLTTSKIRLQYDRYNRSAHDDRATQTVLGLILDCIEAPTRPLKPAMAQGGGKP